MIKTNSIAALPLVFEEYSTKERLIQEMAPAPEAARSDLLAG